MEITSGARLGPYVVISALGAGGMGEVWRAKDTRLEREVAIKVLPAAFAEDAQLRIRFDREAKAISSLNHPHICTLHDVGHENGLHFLVMELIDGESLADKLQRGPLPPEQVLRYGAQIATALDAAHRQGVIHRDLKPGNIMITKTGAKLLDFGLAKASDAALSGHSVMPTQAKPVTQQGTILGTFQYMSPEQLEGIEVDARSDIFALGAVLYEMATGRRAFQGTSKTSLIAAIVSSQPAPISTIAPLTPPALEHVVRKCLEKDPDERWQSAHDVASELRWISEAGSQAGVASPGIAARRSRRAMVAALAVLGWVAVMAAGFWIVRERAHTEPLRRIFRSELTLSGFNAVVNRGAMVLSPDGRRLVFVMRNAGLGLYDFENGRVTPVPETDGAIYPFWSPDSRWIGFFAEGKLRKVEAKGGPVQVLCDARDGRGGSWSPNGTIIFAPDIAGPLMKVPEGGGTPERLTNLPDEQRRTHRNPHFLPDGEHFLFTSRLAAVDLEASIMVGSLRGGEPKSLTSGSNAQYAEDHLLFMRQGNLVAQRFDLAKQALEGMPLPIAQKVEYFNARDLGNFSVSNTGLLVYRQNVPMLTQVTWFDRNGRVLSSVGDPGFYGLGRAAGNVVALVRRDDMARESVWVMDLRRGTVSRVTPNASTALTRGVPSRDGREVAISTVTGAGYARNGVWIQTPSATAAVRRIVDATSFMVQDWSSDGKVLLGSVQEPGKGFDIAWIPLDDPKKIRVLTQSPANEQFARFSPDGRWIAYTSDESGSNEVYFSDFPEAKNRWQVTRTGGNPAGFAHGGRELIVAAAGRLIVYPIEVSGGEVSFGNPVPLPQMPGGTSLLGTDGDRLLMLRSVEEQREEPVRVVRNWQELVK